MRTPTASGLGSWFHTKVVDPLLLIIHRGAEPKQLAFSSALGFTFGVFPICGSLVRPHSYIIPLYCSYVTISVTGVTVFLCGLAIPILGSRCNAPTVLLSNFVATPLELSLIIPFLRLGETVTGSSHFELTSDALKKVLTGKASTEVLLSIVRAMLGWLIAAPFILAALYLLLLPCFKFLVRKYKAASSSSDISLKNYGTEEHQEYDSEEVTELLTPLRSS